MNKAELGQVFTNQLIADYMVSLFNVPKEATILEPCFGGGAFIDALQRASFSNIFGCELDDEWFKKAESRLQQVVLHHGDFLKYQPNILFDGVIMNPPYIRQEKIDDLEKFGITKDILSENPIFQNLPRTANLYMYFVLKAISLLKPEGQMIIIFPSSWLDARGGKIFREYLYTECDVIKQIHVHGEAFEGAAIVDVVILKVINRKSTNCTEVVSLTAENGNIQTDYSDEEKIDIGFSVPFSDYGSVRRGLTTGYNEAFINPVTEYNLNEFLHPIISSPKDIIGYSTAGARYDRLLLVPHQTEMNADLCAYIEHYKNIILESKTPKTLYEKIIRGASWHELNVFEGKGIIFSYFVRNDMKFVVHEGNAIIRDNFYVITPSIDIFLMTALLNNYYTFYQLEKAGKKYGAGLLKLQRYDIENLFFPDISRFGEADINTLIETARELIETGSKECIPLITSIIAKASDISSEEITKIYYDTKQCRLENR